MGYTRSVAAATYYADPLLRICRQYAPPGIRIAGELDYQAADPLALALAEAVRLSGDITVNMTAMTFIDARCSLMVADAARTLAAASRRVRLRCLPEVVAGFAVLHGAGHGRVRLWTQDGSLHCQVSDAGPARRDESGTPPRALPWPVERGHGLWMVAQITDRSSIDHGPAGTTVTARFVLSPAR